ncbi:hypothetical protein NT6N_17960 [Oceaniferula spumae]|uniref:Uncharacterized protein n=1 Tax=Oceaniferula spumae TaxID=2979115 RepID=A0AAT9FLA7_9BACT
MTEDSAEIYAPSGFPIPVAELSRFFNSLDDWVIVKNQHLFKNLERGGDCDIIVRDKDKATALLVKLLGKPHYVVTRSSVQSFYYSWGSIDFVKSVVWKGIVLIDQQKLIKSSNRNSPEGWPLLPREYEVTLKLIYSLVWGGFVKERYWSECISYYRDNKPELTDILERSLGRKASALVLRGLDMDSGEYMVERIREVRKEIALYQIKRDFSSFFFGAIEHFRTEIALLIFSPTPLSFVFGDSWPTVDRFVNKSNSDSKRFPTSTRAFNIQSRSTLPALCHLISICIKNSRFRSKGGCVFVHMNSDEIARFMTHFTTKIRLIRMSDESDLLF